MRAWRWSLSHFVKVRGWSAPTVPVSCGPLGPDDGTDGEPAQGRAEGGRGPVRAGGQGRQGRDPGPVVRRDRLAPRPSRQGAGTCAEAQDRLPAGSCPTIWSGGQRVPVLPGAQHLIAHADPPTRLTKADGA